MPFKEEMSWDPTKRRWHRMHKGVMYRVPASSLGTPPTRDATRQQANEWWLAKLQEVEGRSPEQQRQELVQKLREAIEEPLTVNELNAVLTKRAGALRPKRPDSRSVKACGDNFLTTVRGEMRPRTYEELAAFIKSLGEMAGVLAGVSDVGMIDENVVERVYLHLKGRSLSAGRKKKFWGFFRRFLKYLWERRLIEMPRNLASHKFDVRAKKIKTYTPDEVRGVLKDLKPRLKLYALLALNTGMTQVDIAALKKDLVDLKHGVLTRKRVKTGDNDNVPVVRYSLWPETLALLRKFRSDHPELFLTNMRGSSLVETRYEGDKVRRKDMVVQQWRRAKVAMPLKAFRSVAATWIGKHPVYGRYAAYFLGHSPKSIADKHYVAPSEELFRRCLDWLHGEIFTPSDTREADT